jgi:mRNA interferase MazF
MPTREHVPERGEVWLERPPRDLVGHEQRGSRPVIVVSADAINEGPWPIVVVVPLTTRDRGMPLHVGLEPPDGGVRTRSVALVEQIHAADRTRLVERWGRLSQSSMREVEDRLRIVLQLA